MEDLRRAQSALDRCKVLSSEAESILNASLARFTAQEGGVGTDVCGGEAYCTGLQPAPHPRPHQLLPRLFLLLCRWEYLPRRSLTARSISLEGAVQIGF